MGGDYVSGTASFAGLGAPNSYVQQLCAVTAIICKNRTQTQTQAQFGG